MNQEQFTGFWKQLKEPLQEKWNKLTDEDLLQIDGDMEKFDGVLDLRYGEQKGAVSTWANRRFSHISGIYVGYEYGLTSPEPNP